MTDDNRPHLAILIDADNVPPRSLDGIFVELKRYGPVTARHAYGNFSGAPNSPWTEALLRHALSPMDPSAYGTRKNAADIALVIDAMDLLHSGRFGGFAIVTGDSDFTRLALRIRERGLPVYVFGPRTSSDGLRKAATRFIHLENLRHHAAVDDPNMRAKALQEPRAALPLIREAVLRLAGRLDGWIPADVVEEELYRCNSDFDSRTYGHRKFISLLVAMKGVNVRRPQNEPARMRLTTRKARRRKPAEVTDSAGLDASRRTANDAVDTSVSGGSSES